MSSSLHLYKFQIHHVFFLWDPLSPVLSRIYCNSEKYRFTFLIYFFCFCNRAFSPNCSRTCHPSCLTCVEDSDSCLQCPSATYLAFGEREINHMMSYANTNIDGYGCVNVCPDATYPFRIGEHEICLSCPPLCKSCSGKIYATY